MQSYCNSTTEDIIKSSNYARNVNNIWNIKICELLDKVVHLCKTSLSTLPIQKLYIYNIKKTYKFLKFFFIILTYKVMAEQQVEVRQEVDSDILL